MLHYNKWIHGGTYYQSCYIYKVKEFEWACQPMQQWDDWWSFNKARKQWGQKRTRTAWGVVIPHQKCLLKTLVYIQSGTPKWFRSNSLTESFCLWLSYSLHTCFNFCTGNSAHFYNKVEPSILRLWSNYMCFVRLSLQFSTSSPITVHPVMQAVCLMFQPNLCPPPPNTTLFSLSSTTSTSIPLPFPSFSFFSLPLIDLFPQFMLNLHP